VTESEFLERFDAHIAESRALNAEVRDEVRLSREQHADLRGFIRDLTRRNEIVLGEMASNLGDMASNLGQMASNIGEMSSNLAELNQQTRAHTQGLLSVLDRLN
jgi:methyl-accepting chemotaxis protein